MALVFSGYSSGTDAAEPLIPPDEYNTNYKVGFYYDTSLDANGNTAMRVARVALQSNLRWDPTNFYGYTQLFGYAYLSVKVGSASAKKEYGYDFNYEIYDPDGNPCSYKNPVGGPNEPALFAYDGIEYPETKPHAPTITLPAGSEDSTVVVSVFIEIRDGEIGYLYKGNKSAWISVPRNQWTVKLHPNGGVVDGSSATTVTKTKRYNQTLTIPTPTKTNAVFRGWYTNAQGTGNPVSASYTQNADLELWAIWYEPYAVTYDGNPASEATNVPAQQWKVYNQTLTLSGQKPARSGGYVFKEWNTRKDGTGTSYASGASYSTNAALTLYAIWYPPYGIAYNGNGGSDTASAVSNVPSMQIKSHGVALTLSSQKPTRPGYSFARWNTNSSGTGTSYNPGDTYPASNNAHQVLYAIWTPTVDSKAVTVNKSVRTGSISSETEADEGGYAFIDFSYSFVGAASGTVSVSVGRTPEGGTRTPVPAARISGDTAKSKGVGYATLSGNVKVHDDGGGSLPTTTRYKYDITVTFAGTSATGASYIEKAFFTISVLGDGVSGQTPGHGIAFGMPATRAAFEVGPSMPGHFWAALEAHQNLVVDGRVDVGGDLVVSQHFRACGSFRMGRTYYDFPASTAAGWYTFASLTSADAGYFTAFVFINGGWNYTQPTGAILGVSCVHGAARINQISCSTVGIFTKARLVGSAGTYKLQLYLNGPTSSGGLTGAKTVGIFGMVTYTLYATPVAESGTAAAEVTFNADPPGSTRSAQIGEFANGISLVTIKVKDPTVDLSQSNNGVSANRWGGYYLTDNNDYYVASFEKIALTNGNTGIGMWAYNRDSNNNQIQASLSMQLSKTGVVSYSVSNYSAFRNAINALGGEYANSYWGVVLPGGSTSDWLRTTQNGIIPYKSGGASDLGTDSWPFNNVWAKSHCSTGTSYAFALRYNGTSYPAIYNHLNGNVSFNAASGGVYLGYLNTTKINFLSGASEVTTSAIRSYGATGVGNKITVTNSSNNYEVGLHIGGGGVNHGLYDFSPRDTWLLYSDASTTYLDGYKISHPPAFKPDVLYANSTGTNGNIPNLPRSVANFTHLRIYFRDSGSNERSSVVMYRPDGPYVNLSVGVIQKGSPNKFWVKARELKVSGTSVEDSTSWVGQIGFNSTGTWGINENKDIYITRIEAWNE